MSRTTKVRSFRPSSSFWTCRCLYTYDWGDQWVHSITVESYDMAELKAPAAGTRKGEAPEEDSGGPDHWMWLREHPEEREAMYR